VLPKGGLLRFVQGPAGDAVFDVRQREPGRGFYLCPERSCFLGAWRNRKARWIVADEAAGARLSQAVCAALLDAAQSRPLPPAGAPGRADSAQDLHKGSPRVSNLQMYERLSSKGLS
jgi:predicted RNA-binding protein YlxR (DUF448 family)